MVIMGNDGHTPSLPIPFYECGPHNGLRKVRTAECLLGNGVLHQTDTPRDAGGIYYRDRPFRRTALSS